MLELSQVQVSVLLPVHNGERYVARAISSLLNQTHKKLEIIVVNDRSTDSTGYIVDSFSDSRLKHINLNSNKDGLVGALNCGLQHCVGDFVVRQDADDYSHPERIERSLKYLLENALDGVLTSIFIIDDKSDKVTSRKGNAKSEDLLLSVLLKKKSLPIVHPTLMIKREVIQDLGYRNFKHCEDRDLWLRLFPHYSLELIEDCYYYYNLSDSGISRIHSLSQFVGSNLLISAYVKNRLGDLLPEDFEKKRARYLRVLSFFPMRLLKILFVRRIRLIVTRLLI